jgi:nucleoside-diphosphate-sugar epimerase
MLTGQAPIVLFDRRRVLYWSSADQVLDFTTKDDTARVTALVALDDDAPRVVEVAGDRVTARDLARIMTEVTGTPFQLQWAGTTGVLAAASKAMRRVARDEQETFPAWQGMQYLVSMYSGEAELRHVDRERFGELSWTGVREVLAAHVAERGSAPAA